MRGRRPDGPGVQELKGNPGKRRRKTMEDVVDAAALDDGTPRHLSENARKFWARVAPELTRLKFVRQTDRPVLERYCESLANYWQIQLKLRGKQLTYWTDSAHGKMKRVDPLFLVLQRVEKMLFDYEDRIGLNPAARQRIILGMAASQGKLPLDNPNPSDTDGSEGATDEGGDAKPASPIGLLSRMH